ncbi:MAG: ABC transporter permease [Halobacteriales archaeon]|nr:ABC transporter permease [Halobacteriales archaeon]
MSAPASALPSPVRVTRLEALQPRMREWRYSWYLLKRSKLAMVGLGIVLFYVLLAILAPVIAPAPSGARDPYEMQPDFANELLPPGGAHPLGTSTGGIDLFYGIVWGARISMAMGLSVVAVGVVVGLVLGVVAGYYGGWIDELLLRITDVFLALPLLILAMAVAIALERSLGSITLALIATWWPPYVRLVRGQALLVREQQFVEAARASGASDAHIMWRHILPNSFAPVVVQLTLDIGVVVLVAASLAFLGFSGTNTFTTEWGSLVSIGQRYVAGGQWWTVTFPGLAIFGFVLGFNLLGDGLRDILDPRLRK